MNTVFYMMFSVKVHSQMHKVECIYRWMDWRKVHSLGGWDLWWPSWSWSCTATDRCPTSEGAHWLWFFWPSKSLSEGPSSPAGCFGVGLSRLIDYIQLLDLKNKIKSIKMAHNWLFGKAASAKTPDLLHGDRTQLGQPRQQVLFRLTYFSYVFCVEAAGHMQDMLH